MSVTTAEKRFSAARFELIRGGKCVPQIALGLAAIPDKDAAQAEGARAFTDGSRIVYDPAHLVDLKPSEREGLVWEEIGHVELLHPWRLRSLIDAGCDRACAQEACEHEIAAHIAKAGGDLGEHPPCPQEFQNMGAEAIAWTLNVRPKPPGGGKRGGGKAGVTVIPAAKDTASQQTAARTKAQLLAHAAGKQRGELPAGMERLIRQLLNPACRDLLAALLEFQMKAKGAPSADFTRPDRRRMQQTGFWLPSRKSKRTPPLAAAVDTSGSVSQDTLAFFAACVQTVLTETKPLRLHTYACDAAVQADRTLEPGDTVPLDWPGGGGTDFRPVFNAINKLEEKPVCLAFLTDLDGTFPEKQPEYPTLWVITDPNGERPVPEFGQAIYLDR